MTVIISPSSSSRALHNITLQENISLSVLPADPTWTKNRFQQKQHHWYRHPPHIHPANSQLQQSVLHAPTPSAAYSALHAHQEYPKLNRSRINRMLLRNITLQENASLSAFPADLTRTKKRLCQENGKKKQHHWYGHPPPIHPNVGYSRGLMGRKHRGYAASPEWQQLIK